MARMKLQRVVFGAFALVLVSLFALGLSAYRHMQRERASAQAGQAEALASAAAARSDLTAADRELQQTRDGLSTTRRELAASHCRMAMVEAAEGNTAHARALLAEARRLGPPSWWPLVAHATNDSAPRFSGSEGAILAGALSADGRVLGVLRAASEGLELELHATADGRLLRTESMKGFAPDSARLLLSGDGSQWFAQTPEHVVFGRETGVQIVGASPGQIGVIADGDFSAIYEAAGARGLLRRNFATGVEGTVALGLPEANVMAVSVHSGRVSFATDAGLYTLEAEGRAGLAATWSGTPQRVALYAAPGATFAALLSGRELELVSVGAGGPPVSVRYEVPDDDGDVAFTQDGTALWLGRAGRAVLADFAASHEWSLGGQNLVFVGRHARGLVFANRRGEISLRIVDGAANSGRALAPVAPSFVASVRAHGFVLTAPDGALFVVHNGRAQALEPAGLVALAPPGAVVSGERLRLIDGSRSTEEGVLLGALFDGSAVLYSAPRKLKRVSASGVTERLLPNDRAPDAFVVAADAGIAAFRAGNTVYVTDFVNDAVALTSPFEVAPDLLALEAGGTRLAVAYGPNVVVHNLVDDSLRTLRTAAAPTEIALLFGGSVLVTLESGALVYTEVETGRELLRSAGDWVGMQAASAIVLRLAGPARLVELRLNE